MEYTDSKLKLNEIRCPYCRKKQQGLLEYYHELGLEKVNGVNFYDPNLNQVGHSSYSYKSHKCEFQYPNNNYDSSKPESSTNSKYLNQYCGHYNGTQIVIFNSQNPSEPINYGDTKYYCYTHKREMIKHYKQQQKEKEKLEKKQAKELEKQTKLLEKQKAKINQEEMNIMKNNLPSQKKLLKNKLISENLILDSSMVPTGCIKILKTGLNKGNQCGCKISSENMCKRHYLLSHK
jgi:hypothetical protein